MFSDAGIGGMSRGFHRLWQNHLLPRRWMNRPRPILLNSWEAAYFDFDEEKLLAIAGAAAPPAGDREQPRRRQAAACGEPVRRIAPGRQQGRRDHSC